MNFEWSEEERLLVDNVQALVKKESPITRARAMRSDPTGWDRGLWKRLGDLGYLGLFAPEAAGGSQTDFASVALVVEQFGTTLMPEPFVESAVVATACIARLGKAAQLERFLGPAVRGETSLAVAWSEKDNRFSAEPMETRASKAGDGYVLSGTKVFVANGHAADEIVVSAKTDNGVALLVVNPKEPGVKVTSVKTMDGRHAAHLTFSQAPVSHERLLGDDKRGLAELEFALDCGRAAAAAEAVGLLRTVLQTTCDYLRTREQFGVKIGSFQALQHRAADMFIESELARSAALMAALKINQEQISVDDRMSAISAAMVQVAESGAFITRQAIQLHGGIAMTDEHDIGLFFKRMHTLSTAFGDSNFHAERYASVPAFFASAGD